MITRRHLLAAGLVLAAGGAGAAVGLRRPIGHHDAAPKQPPAQLASALAREQDLIAAIRLAAQHDPALRSRLDQVQADHTAHVAALESAIAGVSPAGQTASPHTSPPAVAPPSLARLRAAELRAARLAAAESAAMSGADAALLASISASESTHAELLT